MDGLLFIFFIFYFSLVFILRSIKVWKRTGVNPITFNKNDDIHGFNGKVLLLIILLELIVIGIYDFKSDWYEYLLPFWYLEYPELIIVGWICLFLSLIIVCISQSQMETSWRIGIDKENKTTLVTKGLFSISRNPIFLGLMIGNLGLFFIIPNCFTLLVISLSTISINNQIRLEEEFLKREFGDEYEKYSKKVRRWF